MDKLGRSVLVLNKLWQAVNLCNARRAFCLLCKGNALVVEPKNGTYESFDFQGWKGHSANGAKECEIVHTVYYSLKIPNIVILTLYDEYPSVRVKLSRANVYKRDKHTCQYCGRKLESKHLNIDHVLPRNRGGKTTWNNVVCSCQECNLRKGGNILPEAGMKLLKKPRLPVRYPLQDVQLRQKIRESWSPFLDLSKWKVEVGEDQPVEVENLKGM